MNKSEIAERARQFYEENATNVDAFAEAGKELAEVERLLG